MPELELQPSLSTDLRSQALLALIERLGALDLTPILVYRIDSVPASALPFLAWQFDLLSPLWALLAPAQTSAALAATQARRNLIKLGIALHSVRGTPYAILTALNDLGWPEAVIQEGQASWGGTSWPSNEGWAVCRIIIPLAATFAYPSAAEPWDDDASYAPGAIVRYNGAYFLATGAPLAGVPPAYGAFDLIDPSMVADWDTMLTFGWSELEPITNYAPPLWSATASYAVGAIVGWIGSSYLATGPTVIGRPPAYEDADDVEDPDAIIDTDNLVTSGWALLAASSQQYLFRVPSATDAATIIAAFEFFKNARSWLDSVWFEWPPLLDTLAISDTASLGPVDAITPRIHDSLLVAWPSISDTIAAVPDHSRRWQHAGVNYSKRPVGIVDGAIVVNGTPVEGNQ